MFLMQAVAQPLPLPMIQTRMEEAHIFEMVIPVERRAD